MLLPNREWIFITKHGIHQHFFATILGGIWLKMLKMLVQSIPYMWLGWHVFLGMWKPVVAMFKSLWLNRLKFWTCFPAHHLVPPKYVLFFSLVGLVNGPLFGRGDLLEKKQVLQRVATRWSEVWERTARKTPGLQQGVVEPQLGWWGRLRFLLFSVFLAEMPSPGTSSDRLSNQVTSWHDQSVGITKMIQNGPNGGWTPWQTHRNYSCLCGPSEYWCGDAHDSQQDKVNT